MRNIYKVCVLLVFGSIQSVFGQLLEENFNYTAGQNLTSNNFSAYSDAGNTPFTVTSGSLTFSGYGSSGIGNSTTVNGGSGGREDVERTFTTVSNGSLYTSFLVNVTAAPATGTAAPFFSLRSGTTEVAKVFIVNDGIGSGFEFGIHKNATNPDQTTIMNYSLNTTYLLILKYTFLGGSNNDEFQLFVSDNGIPADESQPTLSTNDGFDATSLSAIRLIQNTQNLTAQIDGIRVNTDFTFSDAPLPVEMMNFSVSSRDEKVVVTWATASETNNAGFEVYRSEKSDILGVSFKKIGSYLVNTELRGLGSSSVGRKYSFTDNDLLLRKGTAYTYKIVDVATDGGRVDHGTKEIRIEANETSAGSNFTVQPIWPNPAQGKISMTISISENTNLSGEIYNESGVRVLSPLSDVAFATGEHTLTFSTVELPVGMYTLRVGGELGFHVYQFIIIR